MKMKKLYLIVLLFGVVACECESDSMVRKQIIKECQGKSECSIHIKDFTDFYWEKLYVFDEGASLPLINKQLGFKYLDYIEFERVILFVSDNEIVHKETEEYSPSGRSGNSIWFDLSGRNYGAFEPDDRFIVTQENFDGKVYYTINPQ